ncbi:hypothetical protein SteCoe_5084 [Stentor coeruleus]|uniref:Uncharacterized protein n=1 Tax=Stentor coeruleus TaxID=5963 RepID=A0A1R2CT60_9CILI|nr:hypothetical protein SteCoe_5084 [Stentor coeruleus]
MLNEWNNLSESFSNRQKQLASIKVKRKSPIYKHIVIKKCLKSSQEPLKPEIEVKKEFLLLPAAEETRQTHGFCSAKPRNRMTTLNSTRKTPDQLKSLRETSLDINSLKGKQDLPSYLMNSRINLGKKLNDIPKTNILKSLSISALDFNPDQSVFKYFSNDLEGVYNVVCFGGGAPVSKCCKLNIIVSISKTVGGKLICPHRNCVIKCLSNFMVDKDERDLLWGENEEKVKKSENNMKKLEEIRIGSAGEYSISMLCLQSKTLSAPRDTFSAFIDPLKQILKSNRRIKYKG